MARSPDGEERSPAKKIYTVRVKQRADIHHGADRLLVRWEKARHVPIQVYYRGLILPPALRNKYPRMALVLAHTLVSRLSAGCKTLVCPCRFLYRTGNPRQAGAANSRKRLRRSAQPNVLPSSRRRLRRAHIRSAAAAAKRADQGISRQVPVGYHAISQPHPQSRQEASP
jgi:hypothetical protein